MGNRDQKTYSVTILLFAVAAVMLLIGVTRGEALIVFTKACRICLECIGIG